MAGFGRSREVTQPNAIVGAARRVHIDNRHEVERLRERGIFAEQELAWRYYDKIGEIKTAYNYYAAVASRVRIHVGYQSDVGVAPAPIGEVESIPRSLVVAARQELDKLSQGRGGQPNLIRSFVLNLLVPGECYLVGVDDKWTIRSTSELVFEADGRVRIVQSRRDTRRTEEYLPRDAFVARIWRTHPQYSDDADSALMGMLEDCSELLMTARLIRAAGKSQMNAGLLYVADELRFQRSSDPGSPDGPQPDIDPFEEELMLALTEPIGATDSPSEVMPLLVRGPAALSEDGIKHHDLSRAINEVHIKRFKQLVERILQNLDVPSDLVTGMSQVRYSNARTISEDFLKAYIEPMILIICEGITTVFLRPQLVARGFDPELVKNVHVWYDPSEVVTRPDRSDDADKGYERILVSGRTWRRAHGFSEADAPELEEVIQRIALAGTLPQEATIEFLRLVAPDAIEKIEMLSGRSLAPAPLPPGPKPPDVTTPPASADNPLPVEPPEGHLEPGVNGRPTGALAIQSERVDLLSLIRSMSASGALTSSAVVQDRTRRLERALEVERRLRESMFVQLNDIVQRSLERAGARTVSKTVRKDADLRAVLSAVPMEEAYAAVPEDRLAEFGLSDASDLVRDTVEKAKNKYVSLVKGMQDQGWLTLGGEILDARRETQADDLERSWSWLSGKLVTLATTFLRNPKTRGSYVSMDVVRDAAALAGGGRLDPNAPDNADVPQADPPDSGRAILGGVTLEATGWTFGGRFRWVYGVSETQFEPHIQLDGVVFDSWRAKTLASSNPDEWPYITHYSPGDHGGCRCDWLPEVVEPVPAEGDQNAA